MGERRRQGRVARRPCGKGTAVDDLPPVSSVPLYFGEKGVDVERGSTRHGAPRISTPLPVDRARRRRGGEAMDASPMRTAVEAVVQHLADHPDDARSRDRPARAVVEQGLRIRVQGPGGWSVVTDMPQTLGGGASAPSPGGLLRAAQAACNATMIALRAAQEAVALTTLEVTVDSESDDRGLVGVDEAVPAGPLSSRTHVRIGAAGVPAERLRAIVQWGDAHSPVADAGGRAVPRTVGGAVG